MISELPTVRLPHHWYILGSSCLQHFDERQCTVVEAHLRFIVVILRIGRSVLAITISTRNSSTQTSQGSGNALRFDDTRNSVFRAPSIE